jgi:hypothetical protein
MWCVLYKVLKTLTRIVLKNGYRVKWASRTQHVHTVSAAAKQKGEEQDWEDYSEICTATWNSLNSSKNMIITTISHINVSCVKKSEVICDIL